MRAGARLNFAYCRQWPGWLTKNGYFGVFVRFVAMKWLGVCGFIGSALAIAAGCATPEVRSSAQAEAAEPLPVQQPMTPDQEKERADARWAYVSCLRQAAQFMSTRGEGTVGDQASLIAPLCYAQFVRFEDASTVAMSTRDRRTFDLAGDKRQLDFAADAVRQQHGLAALTPVK
jgi:hypothetical protein